MVKTVTNYNVLTLKELSMIKGGGGNLGPGVYCRDVNGRAKCSVDQSELWAYTGRVIVNGGVNYGPWYPRP